MKKFLLAAALAAIVSPSLAADPQPNRVPSVKELQDAAQKNNPVAQNNLAVKYATGDGVKQDYKEAAKWYQKAGEQGYAVAQYNLGALYEHGLGVPTDFGAAKVWYELAAQQGDTWAQLSLGQMLVSDNLVGAYKWLYLASVGDDSEVKGLAANELKRIGGKLSPKQLNEANAQIKAWRPVKN